MNNSLFGWHWSISWLAWSYQSLELSAKRVCIHFALDPPFVGTNSDGREWNRTNRFEFIVKWNNHWVLVPILPNIQNYNATYSNRSDDNDSPPNSTHKHLFWNINRFASNQEFEKNHESDTIRLTNFWNEDFWSVFTFLPGVALAPSSSEVHAPLFCWDNPWQFL